MQRVATLIATLLLSLSQAFSQVGHFFPSEQFSSGQINDVCQDQYGYMWIATENGLNKFDGYRFTTYLNHPEDSTTLGTNIVVKLYCDKKGQLWVGTRVGLARYDYATDRFVHYRFTNGETPRVISILERQDGELLVGTSGRGLFRLMSDSLQKVPGGYSSSGGNWYYNQMMEDSQRRFWKCGYGEEVTMMDAAGVHSMLVSKGIVIGMAEVNSEILVLCMYGIHSYPKDSPTPGHNQFLGPLPVADIDLSALGSGKVIMSTAYQDHEGNIYIGTRGDGLFRLAKGSRKVVRVESSIRGMDLNTAKIWAITEDRLGNIWIGCEQRGLVMLPRIQPQFSSWSFSAQGYNISSTITSVCQGDNGITWCTVQGNGVYGFDTRGRIVSHPAAPLTAEYIYRDRHGRYWIATNKDLYAYNPLTGSAQQQATYISEKLNRIIDDAQGNLYLSTYSRGFSVFNPETRSLRNYLATDRDGIGGRLWNNWILDMIIDHEGRIWFATSAGVSCYDPKTGSFHPYGWDSQLDGIMCYSLCETRRGQLLIGTELGLYVYDQESREAKPFPQGDGLRNRVVSYMVESANGDLWCSTSMGIWQYDVRKKQFIGHVNGNGLAAKEYLGGVGLHTADDAIYLAYNDGLTVFQPSQVTGSHKKLPAVRLTGFFIAGNAVNTLTESDGHQVASRPVIQNDHYRVSYLDNSLTLEFSLLDFNNPRNIIYEYRINEGKWMQNPEGQNSIQLNHLQPGDYTIEVRALSSGNYSPTLTLTLTITPPWYQSTWAYLFYALFVLALLRLAFWLWRRRTRQQLDEEKMKFLINATHDIRSPLTLIMGALGKLKNLHLDGPKTPEELSSLSSQISNPLEAIDRNAKRLMLLVNQILDERRIDKNQMQLHCRETNMVEFISRICKLYQYSASQRNITFTFEHDKDHVLAWIDRIHFDKVISNLLSNAFKYTFDGGDVRVTLRDNEKEVEIQVLDNGTGFKEDNPERLFDRFYQGRNSGDLGLQGTGIGLNLCRAITQLHGGRIHAQNRSDGQQGALFTVVLPKGNRHLKPAEIVTEAPAREVLSAGTPARNTSRQANILIVDDDPEIADYIIEELGDRYHFDHAPDGKEALKTLLTREYDLVVSDVMMPRMDGMTLLKRIKTNPNISQLPVIMLTSKAEVEHKLQGLKTGADAYIAKPFNMEELHLQIDNLIDNVRRLRGKFSGAVAQESRVEKIEMRGNDDALMDRIMRSVNANMSNPSFNVDLLSSEVGISRAQLHRKMKEITGISSGKFLRNLRMEQAARLLRQGQVNVSQVAYSVGYVDQAHFSTAFKTHFGQSPSEYVETHKGDGEVFE